MAKKIIMIILSFFVFIDILFIYLILTTTPITLKRTRFTYEYGETINTDPSYYFNANDHVLMNVQMNLTNILTEVGIYQASATYYDTVFDFEVEVIDTVKPKFILKQVEYEVILNEKIYAEDLLVEIEDLSETKIHFINEETNEKFDYKVYNEVGSYIERIIVEDVYGNQSASLRVKISVVKNKVPPYFIGIENIEIKKDSYFDPLEKIKAVDELDGDLTNSIMINGTVNVNECGTYALTYTVSDSDGNTVKTVRIIKVVE